MKVGDLVTLSSYGVDRNYNSHITMADFNQVGLVVGFHKGSSYEYRILWSKVIDLACRTDRHTRRELKHAKR